MLKRGFKFYRTLTVATCLAIVFLHLMLSISLVWLLVPLLLFLVLIGVGSAKIDSQFFVNALCEGDASKKQIAITFDDGPNAEHTPRILATLKKYKAKATFFVIGKNIAAAPDLIKKIDSEGHLLGNHSFSHSNTFAFKREKGLTEELKQTNTAVLHLTGKEMRFFRPPFGVTSPSIAKASRKLNFKVIGWSIRSLDTKGEAVEIISERVLRNIKPGKIILLHDTFLNTNAILEDVLLYCKDNAIAVVSLEKLLNKKAYV